jgi:hypothetical protein
MLTVFFLVGDAEFDPGVGGVEFPDIQVAQNEATQMLVELVLNTTGQWQEVQITAVDEDGLILFTAEIVVTMAPVLRL